MPHAITPENQLAPLPAPTIGFPTSLLPVYDVHNLVSAAQPASRLTEAPHYDATHASLRTPITAAGHTGVLVPCNPSFCTQCGTLYIQQECTAWHAGGATCCHHGSRHQAAVLLCHSALMCLLLLRSTCSLLHSTCSLLRFLRVLPASSTTASARLRGTASACARSHITT